MQPMIQMNPDWVTTGPILKFVEVKLYGPERSVNTFAFLDEGSTVTLMKKELAIKIGMTSPKAHLHLQGLNGATLSNAVGTSSKTSSHWRK